MKMMREHPFLFFLAAITVLIGLSFVIRSLLIRWNNYQDWQKLFVGCYSDKLGLIADAYQSAIEESKEGWPSKELVISKLKPDDRDWLSNCVENHQPFVWCESTLNLKRDNPYPVPLVWCPPGAHGKYVGVVLLRDGKINHEMMTEDERQHLIPPER